MATLQTPPLPLEEDPAGVRYGTEDLPSAHSSAWAARLLLPSPTAPALPLVYAAQGPGGPGPCVKRVKTARNHE